MGIFTKKHSIGKTIAELRKQKGWSQNELAEKLQVSDNEINKWEKDSGAPSIEFFPLLAELFDVSIDYLMTGKVKEKEIVTMSKAELCAKKDDVKLVKEIDINHKDENGKTFIDYILQYESVKVFIELCTISARNISYFDILDALKMCLISNKLDLMVGQTFRSKQNRNSSYKISGIDDILKLLPTQAGDYPRFKQGKIHFDCILNDDFYDLVVKDKRINSQTLSIIFGKQQKRECVWYHAFPYFINKCYINGNYKMLDTLLALAIDSNEKGYERMKAGANGECSLFFVQFNGYYYPMDGGHGFVRILEETIKLSLKNGDFKYFEKFNKINTELIANITKYLKMQESAIRYSFNAYIGSEYDVKMAKLKFDKSISKDELAVQSSIHDGIIYIDELLALGNVKVIKKALNDYPIHLVEKLFALYDKKQWKELFQWAVDVNNHNIYNAIIQSNFETVKWEICKYSKIETPDFKVNRKHLKVVERKEVDGRIRESIIQLNCKGTKKEDLLDFFKTCKTQILESITLSIDKEETIAELSKEFFEKELTKGNTEMVIIKLCVRLESVLKCNYHYEGDFADMITRYCNEKLNWQEDDGWGYTIDQRDDKKIKILHKLRKQRNSIVHSEKNNEPMTIAEIKECIDLICAIK